MKHSVALPLKHFISGIDCESLKARAHFACKGNQCLFQNLKVTKQFPVFGNILIVTTMLHTLTIFLCTINANAGIINKLENVTYIDF